MAKKTMYERVKLDLEDKGKAMANDFKNKGSFRKQIYRLKKDGFIIERIGERGNIKGYQLAQAPEDYKQ